jgi:hypothetical protein
MYDGKGGFAGNVSAALDLGKNKNACLFGTKYALAINKLEKSGVEQKQSGLSFFVKYAYRQKAKPVAKKDNALL